MGLENLFGQIRSGMKIEESEKVVESQTSEDTKILNLQDVDTIFPAREIFLANAGAIYSLRDTKAITSPRLLTIGESVFTDQPKPVSPKEKTKETLEASIPREVEEKKTKDLVKEQEIKVEEGKDGKKMPGAARLCTLETYGEKEVERETCLKISPGKESLDEKISPTKLSEMINNSIKEAVQTIVGQCSMQEKKPTSTRPKESEKKSCVCRTSVMKDQRKNSSNIYNNRQISYHIPWWYNNLPTCDNPQPFITKQHGNTAMSPVRDEVHNDKRNKRHPKPASNLNTDNRRMTGNVNIYICSEANDNNQMKGKSRLKSQSYADTSSDMTIGQSNSRCATATSASSCKLINSIREKRKKSQMRSPNALREKKDSIGDNGHDGKVCGNKILCSACKIEPIESSKERIDTETIDEDAECRDTVSSTRDGCCCKDASSNSTDFRQDSSTDSVVPCSRINDIRDDYGVPPSWTAIYPSETTAGLNDSDVPLLNAVCTGGNDYRKSDERINIWRNDNANMVCDAADGNSWLSRSIYTDSVTYSEIAKASLTSNYMYRNKNLQDPMVNRDDIRRRQIGRKLLERCYGRCEREDVTRRCSRCSCIAEEEEDYCTNVNSVERNLSENTRNDAKRSEKVLSVCRTPSNKLTENITARETAFDDAKMHFEKIQRCKSTVGDLGEYSKDAMHGAMLKNAKERPKVTEVCKKFVAEEPPKDITVCKTTFTEPKESPKEVTVCEIVLPDSESIPKKTVCKISNSNFANQDDVKPKEVSLSDAKDRFANEKTDNSNLKDKEINGAKSLLRADAGSNNVSSNNIIGQGPVNVEHDGLTKKDNLDDEPNIPSVSIRSDRKFNSISRNTYSTSPRVKFYNRSKLALSAPGMVRDVKETSGIFVDQHKTAQLSPLNRSNDSPQQSDKMLKDPTMEDLSSNEHQKGGRKIQENSKKKTEEHDVSREIVVKKEPSIHQKDSFLYRSFKKLLNIIKGDKMQFEDRVDTKKIEFAEAVADDKKDNIRSTIVPLKEKKIDDKEDYQDTNERMHTSVKTAIAREEIVKNVVHVTSEPSVSVFDFAIPGKDGKMDIPSRDQTVRPKPKLLRIIAEKRSHLRSTKLATDQKSRESEVESTPIEITVNERHVDQTNDTQDSIPEDADEIKMETTIVHESVIEGEDIPKESTEEIAVSKDFEIGPTSQYVPCPQRKKSEEELSRSTIDKSEIPLSVNGCSYVPVDYTQCDTAFRYCSCKDNEKFQRRTDPCAYCHLSAIKCTCASKRYLKSCLRTDRPKFRSLPSPKKKSPRACEDCCRLREECKCKGMVNCFRCRRSYEECRCMMYATNHSEMTDKWRRPLASCINCCKPEHECARSAVVECHRNQRDCSCNKAMICLYCDNPQDKCVCRAPIGKCLYCGLPSDVCNCQDERAYRGDHDRVTRQPDDGQMIRVTTWKPNKDIRRYFARDIGDLPSELVEECRCHKPNRQRLEELPYQRLNVFSDVMNELQQKMSESVCCTRCRRNPCCCRSEVDRDEGKEERKVKRYARWSEMDKPRSKSSNHCRCSLSPKIQNKNIVRKAIPIHCTGCICKSSPCRCRKSRPNHKRPLAKCYYCKSLPCT